MSYLLYINSTEQQLWRREGKTWERCAGEPDSTVWVVTDLPEESFTEITIPRLMGRDRGAFIARQLVAAYPDTPYRSFLTPVQPDGLLGKIVPTRQTLFGISAAERINAVLESITAPVAGVWPISMLLADFCKRKELPPDLLVALPGPDTLRIVYLRNRSPAIARLTSTPNAAGAQVEEIIRTLRYLENAQLLPRERKSHSILFLGDNNGLETPIALANLNLVHIKSKKEAPANWRHALFDIAITSPAGQVAPLDRRVKYLSQQLGKSSLVAAVLLVLVGGLLAGNNLYSVFDMRSQRQAVDATTQQTSAEIAATDEAIARFNVAPDFVRRAIALNETEIASVPAMGQHLQLISGLLASDPNLRLASLRWRILKPAEAPCSAATSASQGETGVESTETSNETRKVEIGFDLVLPAGYGPRDRATALRNISDHIAGITGATIWKDATKDFVGGSLRGGSDISDTNKPSWCLTLPGVVDVPTATNEVTATTAMSATAAIPAVAPTGGKP